MNLDDYSLDQLTDFLQDVLHNTDLTPDEIVIAIKSSIQSFRLDLEKKLDRVKKMEKLLSGESETTNPDKFNLTINSLGNDVDKISADELNKLRKSEFYWDKYRNR